MKITIYESTESNYFIKKEIADIFSSFEEANIIIEENIKYQSIIGFGGAITESSAYVYSLLSPKQKKEFINAVFSQEGLNYNLGRLSIGSNDFSLGSYNYLTEDKHFTLKHEEKYLFPILNDIKKIKEISYMISSWSPLKEQKTNNDIYHGGSLKAECYDEYALYLVTYIKEMLKKGFKIKYMTMQNEPLAIQVWESCIFTPEEEAKLIQVVHKLIVKNNLPIDIYLFDHNKDVIVERIQQTLKNNDIINYVKGIAYHWYDNGMHENLTKLHQLYSQLNLLFNEGCIELLVFKDNNAFLHGLRYAREYIRDINNFSNGFIDWNILLDEKGGPNHVGNYCEAPIQYDREKKKLIYNPSYFAIKHLAHFIKDKAKRISCTTSLDIDICAFENQENEYIIVILNTSKEKDLKISFKNKKINLKIPTNAIISIVIRDD